METLLKFINDLAPDKRAEFAARCKTSEGYLRKAVSTGHNLGESLCINIERESRGVVTCEALRPDVDWAYLRRTCKRKAA